MNVATLKPQSPFYEKLLGKVDEKLLHFRDAGENFVLDKMNETYLKYYINNVVDKPWNNHLFLAILVYIGKNFDVTSIYNRIKILNPRLCNLFEYFHLMEMKELNVETHMYEYFKGSIFKEHSDNMRSEFLRSYRSCSNSTEKWVATKIPKEQQCHFEQFIFQMPSYNSRDFTFTKSSKEQSQKTRKSETDAIVPLLPQIRAEGHFRWNQITRLRQAYLKACEQAETSNEVLPLDFYYDEPERVGERFYFRLWDKSSFVLNHQQHFKLPTIKTAIYRTGVYSKENEYYFVEFIKAEQLKDDEVAEGLWFTELFEKN